MFRKKNPLALFMVIIISTKLLFLIVGCESNNKAASSKPGGLVLNADDSHWWVFFNRLSEKETITDNDINQYVNQYANTQITDIMFCIFCQTSNTPTQIMTSRMQKNVQKVENGVAVDYTQYYHGLYDLYENRRIDIFAKWFDRCREVGINPWISFRMNDCHEPDKKASFLRGDLFYEAVANGWNIGEEYGYYRYCYDYSVNEIRVLMLAYMEEQLLRYDVYGAELDFMREIYCFDYPNCPDKVKIMNDLLRKFNSIVKQAEEKWGHDIKIAVRLMRDLDQNLVFGFDALTWTKEKLVDVITASPRWETCDSAMPIADWVERCDGVEIWAGIETLNNYSRFNDYALLGADGARALAVQYFSAGADKFYLFNYFGEPVVENSRNRAVYNTCGSLQAALAGTRKHIVAYQDMVPKGFDKYKPLPMPVQPSGEQTLEVDTGIVPQGSTVRLVVGIKKDQKEDIAKLDIALNSRPGTFTGETISYAVSGKDGSPVPNGYAREDNVLFGYAVDKSTTFPNSQAIQFKNKGKQEISIEYVEINIGP